MRRHRAAAWVLLAVVATLVAAAPALGSEDNPTLAELEGEVICPTCHTVLALSTSPIAERMRAFISQRIGAGDSKSEIKEKLVAEFGEAVLAAPPASGFNVLAWALPIAGGVAALVVVAYLARRWTRAQPRAPAMIVGSPNGRGLDAELERKVDEELARFDS